MKGRIYFVESVVERGSMAYLYRGSGEKDGKREIYGANRLEQRFTSHPLKCATQVLSCLIMEEGGGGGGWMDANRTRTEHGGEYMLK